MSEQKSQDQRTRVYIEDHTGGKRGKLREAKITANATIRDLIPALITALGLPTADPSGRPVTYHLAFDNRQIQGDETLSSAGISDGANITLVPEMTAGGDPEILKDIINSTKYDSLKGDILEVLLKSKVSFEEYGFLSLSELHSAIILQSEKITALEKDLKRIGRLVESLSERSRESTEIPAVEPPRRLRFSVITDADLNISYSIEGNFSYRSELSSKIQIDPFKLNRTLKYLGSNIANCLDDKAGRDSWREEAKNIGKDIYEKVFKNNELAKGFGQATGHVGLGNEEDMSLCFVSPRYFLGVPYELIYDNEPLAIRFPICRVISGVNCSKHDSYTNYISSLIKKNEELRILLIGSDTTENTEADVEVTSLANSMKVKADMLKLKTNIQCITTAEATYGKVESLLNKCSFHIVHFSGKGFFDAATGEGSGLLVWEQNQKMGKILRINARALAQWFRQSETILFFISSDVGAAIADKNTLLDNDYLGVIDALIMAGVPNVLGYRWNVISKSARTFAEAFYKSLFETRSPMLATMFARRSVYIENAKDETWTSPILVSQERF